METNRRRFLIGAAASTALSQTKVFGANERLRLGAIGTGGRMQDLLTGVKAAGGAEIVAVCDVYEPHRARTRDKFAPSAKEFSDYRQVLDQADIDAVVIASPDHWHVRMAVDAIAAGKDVYLEKPVTHAIEEGEALRKAVRGSKKILQCGMQQRSWEHFRMVKELVAGGKLGKVTQVRTYWFQNYQSRGARPTVAADKLDWKQWLGSAPEQPFDEARFQTWRWYWDFGGGALTDLFTHWVDVAHWAMGEDTPSMAQTLGDRYHFMNWDCPDTIQTSMRYPGFQVVYDGTMVSSIDDGGLVFRGTDATIKVDRSGFSMFAESARFHDAMLQEKSVVDGTLTHMANFLDCVRSRLEPNAPVETGIAAARAGHIGNLAYRRGAAVKWPG